jgi:cytochrome c oxidase assembly factor CtaG
VSASDFSFEPAFLVLCAAAGVAYVRAGGRSWLFWLGLFLVAGPLNSPLETIAAHRLLMIHLLQNALIADIAPLVVLLGMTPAMRGMLHIRARYALPLWLLSWYGTHLAGFYDWALRTGWALNIEHALLILGGLLFWWPLISGRLSPPPALAYLGAGFVVSSFLGLALIFSSRPLYSFYEHAPRLWGLSPIRDQNLGGIVMNGEQTLVFLIAIGWYVWRLLEDDRISGAERSPAAH